MSQKVKPKKIETIQALETPEGRGKRYLRDAGPRCTIGPTSLRQLQLHESCWHKATKVLLPEDAA